MFIVKDCEGNFVLPWDKALFIFIVSIFHSCPPPVHGMSECEVFLTHVPRVKSWGRLFNRWGP